MVLVDTSVLIDYLKGLTNEGVRKFDHLRSMNIPFGICELVYQELLQGVASSEEFETLKEYLDTQRFYRLRNGRESHAEAARVYFRCRSVGVTIRSTLDLIIAQIAVENDIALLHNDRDFIQIGKMEKRLRFY